MSVFEQLVIKDIDGNSPQDLLADDESFAKVMCSDLYQGLMFVSYCDLVRLKVFAGL